MTSASSAEARRRAAFAGSRETAPSAARSGAVEPPAAPDDPAARLRERIRTVPDFPRPGVSFRDITPLLSDAADFAAAIEALADPFAGRGLSVVASIESRGFLFAAPLALSLGVGLAVLRKPGKLPRETVRREYRLEYGESALEMHRDAVGPGDRVLIVDDVLATGGSAAAAGEVVSGQGAAVVGYSFLIELESLGGRERLAANFDPGAAAPVIHAVLRYP